MCFEVRDAVGGVWKKSAKRGVMTIIDETKKNQTENSELQGVEDAADKLPAQTIIDFE